MLRSRSNIAALLCLLILVMPAAQASEEPPELMGETVKISEILDSVSDFQGKMVVIEGKIEIECRSGCWFILGDGTASIYVDLLPSGLVIPQKSGSDARVYGLVTTKDGEPMMIGKIVRIDGEIIR